MYEPWHEAVIATMSPLVAFARMASIVDRMLDLEADLSISIRMLAQ